MNTNFPVLSVPSQFLSLEYTKSTLDDTVPSTWLESDSHQVKGDTE